MLPRVVGSNVEASSGNAEPSHLFRVLLGLQILGGFQGRGSLGQEPVFTNKRLRRRIFFWVPELADHSLEAIEGELPCSECKLNFKKFLGSLCPAFLGADPGLVLENS